MTEETHALVDAIASLKQEPSIFKEYIFPIMSAFFSAILGAVIAYFSLRRNESLNLEKDKLIASNKWSLIAQNAFSNLIAIKGNYSKRLSDDPIQRCLAIPTMIMRTELVTQSYQDLCFVVQNISEEQNGWTQIPRIDAMFSNYNALIKMWERRNELNERCLNLMKEKHTNLSGNFSKQQLIESIGLDDFKKLVHLTEMCILYTDHLIREFHTFNEEFPILAKKLIDTKRLKSFGSIIQSTIGNDDTFTLLKFCTKFNVVKLANVLDKEPEEIQLMFSTGYETKYSAPTPNSEG
ncbi:hypothetical protein [Pseudoalteromonas luteoviolacea]|uniref:Uncharacterized protein n=1 Tax=Pseudoalteromonas luteoviolacea S4060-1 TaxID=1365257 RepID=A0A161Z9G8_9GAMM|nr:hypothetical protein [Pseudoalteromonas luteoviolacea]KZN65480.1 hypothetical protein N478_21330 [Pseudoalteromonas luteoviolacea S4060-1]